MYVGVPTCWTSVQVFFFFLAKDNININKPKPNTRKAEPSKRGRNQKGLRDPQRRIKRTSEIP